MGYLQDLFKIFRGTTEGDRTGTGARDAAAGINENTDRINNALAEIDAAAEKKDNKATVWNVINDTLFPTIKNVNTQLEQRLPRGTNTTDTAQSLREGIDENANEIVASENRSKEYTDSFAQGIKWKDSVLATTTGNITLSGEQIIDGVQTNESRILVRAQTNATQNGIYLTSSGAWARTEDADTGDKLISASVVAEQGDQFADVQFNCNSDNIEIGVTAIVWAKLSNIAAHNETTGKQGGQEGEYYHLTLAEKNNVEEIPDIKTAADNLSDTVAEAELDIIDLQSRMTDAETDISAKLDKTAKIQAVWTGTQAEYDAISTPNATTLYFIQ